MSHYMRDLTLSTDFDKTFLKKAEVISCIPAVELPDLVNALSGSNDYVSSSKLAKSIFNGILSSLSDKVTIEHGGHTYLFYGKLLDSTVVKFTSTSGTIYEISTDKFPSPDCLAYQVNSKNGPVSAIYGETELSDKVCLQSVDDFMEVITSLSGSSTFYGCTNLTSVNLPKLKHLATQQTFSGDTGLTSIDLPEVTQIPYKTFTGCPNLVSVSIPKAEQFGSELFTGSRSLSSIHVDNTVCHSIDSGSQKDALVVNNIGDVLVVAAPAINGDVELNGITAISKYAFNDCDSIATVDASSLRELGEGVFTNCGSLVSVNLGDSLTSIPGYTFYQCPSLENISIPKSVTTLSTYAFRGCTSLTSVTFLEDTQLKKLTGDCIFTDCTSLTEIILPNSITSMTIPAQMFLRCSKLSSVALPDSISAISDQAFSGTAIKTLNTENVRKIGAYAFQACYSLSSLNVPMLVSIGASAFNACTSLLSLYITGVDKPPALDKTNIFDGINGRSVRIFVKNQAVKDLFEADSKWKAMINNGKCNVLVYEQAYSISYVLSEDERNDPRNPSSYVASVLPLQLYPAIKVGSDYRFICWRDEDGNDMTIIPAGTTRDLELRPEFAPIETARVRYHTCY